MTPRNSLVGTIAQSRPFSKFGWRALLFGLALLVSGLLSFFPERFLATSSFTPSDRSSIGLGGALGELDAVRSVFGNQAKVEVALRLGDSDKVRDHVIAQTSLQDRLESEGRVKLQRYLREKVEIRSLRGGIILIEMQDRDGELAKEIVAAMQTALQNQLGEISREQTAYKREVLKTLVSDASDDLANAQAIYDQFRLSNGYSEPRLSIAAIGDRVPQLEEIIRGKEIELAKARAIYTERNLTVKQMNTELAAMREQLASALNTAPSQNQGLGELVLNSSKLEQLERDLDVARSLYDNYLRYLQGTAVEDLTAEANLRLLVAPHVETERQIFLPALAIFIAIFLIWGAIEAYRFRPPAGGRIAGDGHG